MGIASHFRSSSSERLRHAAQVQNVNFETNHATHQIRGLVCHDRSQGRILPHIHPSISQEVPEVRFWGKAYQYRVLPFTEFTGTGFYYFSLPRGGRASYCYQTLYPFLTGLLWSSPSGGPSVPSRGLDISPPTRTVETVSLASEWAQLIDSGLSTEVVETILQSLPPPFQNADQERHNLLYPVWALDAYVHRAALWRKDEQLFVCFGPPNKGSPASKQRMSKWMVEVISLAYELAGQSSPMAVRSHSTRSKVASKALISGVALQEVCDATGWSSPHTFVRFYSLDLDSTPGSQVLLS